MSSSAPGLLRRPYVLVSPNAFKGSLTVLEAARALQAGVREALPGAQTRLLPLSDGGDGLIDALLWAQGGRLVPVAVRGPLGERRAAAFALLRDGTAVVEMARASGLALVPPRKRDPLTSTSYGTGQLIAAALRSGARKILVGMGGSAANDGGAGMAQALGCRLLDAWGRELPPGAEALLRLRRVEASVLRRRLRGVRVIAVSDVDNPLLGARGSARVYGPQKGATPRMVSVLEAALRRYARVIRRDLGADVARLPGAGAAGGLGAGLAGFLGAEIVPGAEFVLREIGADAALSGAAAAVTGEGRIDRTSFYGKAAVEFARGAKSRGVPVAAVCGVLDAAVLARLKAAGIGAVATLPEAGASSKDAMRRAAFWAAKAASLAVKRLLLAGLLLGVVAPLRAALPAADSSPEARPGRSGSALDPVPADLAEIDRLYFQRHLDRNLEESLSRIEGLLQKTPEDPEPLWRLGRGLSRLGERAESRKEKLRLYERAEEAARRSVKLKPELAEAHFWLGVSMGRRGETQGILRSLFLVGPIRREMREVIRLDPGHGGAHHVLGEIYLQLPGFAGGDKRKAVAELEEAVRLSPDYTANHGTLAEAYLVVKEKAKAVEVLRKVAQVSQPADPAEYTDNLRDAEALLKKLEP